MLTESTTDIVLLWAKQSTFVRVPLVKFPLPYSRMRRKFVAIGRKFVAIVAYKSLICMGNRGFIIKANDSQNAETSATRKPIGLLLC
jgi:hypothetical protein